MPPTLQGEDSRESFFEPSTRTRSFETAMKRLGGDVVNLGDVKTSSVVKGETLFDTIQMVDGYTDIIAMRHPRRYHPSGSRTRVPILNGGDGAGHHQLKLRFVYNSTIAWYPRGLDRHSCWRFAIWRTVHVSRMHWFDLGAG